jgi:hypothetical protein
LTLALASLGATTGCVALGVAAGAMVGSVGIAVLTQGCYDPIKLQLLDEETGRPVCDARVTAREEHGANAEFSSCFYAELPQGHWYVEASRPGYRRAQAVVFVTKGTRCEPTQQSVTLYFWPQSAPVTGVPTVAPPPLPPPPSATSSAPPPAPPSANPSPPANGVGGAANTAPEPAGGAAPETPSGVPY